MLNTARGRTITLFVAGLLFAGCQHPTAAGQGSFQFVESAHEPVPQRQATLSPSESVQSVIEAQARGPLIPPQYPSAALAARTGRVLVPMRVVVGIRGVVTSVSLRPGTFPALIPRYDEFAHAIEEVVKTWRFTAARIVTSRPETATTHGYTDSEPVEMYFDVDFTFDESTGATAAMRSAI